MTPTLVTDASENNSAVVCIHNLFHASVQSDTCHAICIAKSCHCTAQKLWPIRIRIECIVNDDDDDDVQ